MTKKSLIIIAVIFLIAIAIMVFLYWKFQAPTQETGNSTESVSIFDRFFPFGRGGSETQFPGGGTEGTGSEEQEPIDQTPTARPALRQLTTVPVAGAIALSATSTKTVVRYLERETAHIYDIDPESFEKKRITNTTVPAIREAWWNNDGTKVFLRYLDENDVIKTFVGTVVSRASTSTNSDGGEGVLNGMFINDDIPFITLSPDRTRAFFFVPFGTTAIGTTYEMKTGQRLEIFTTPFTEWLPQWAGSQTIALTTKASAQAEGFLYLLGSRGGNLSKILGNIVGLTTLVSNDQKTVVYSESTKNIFNTKLYEVSDRRVRTLPVSTLPEKCIWSTSDKEIVYCGVPTAIPAGNYPDVWYQGLVSFSDTLWQINVVTGATALLSDPRTDARTDIDAINPQLDTSEHYLIFTNKSDSTLWALKLPENN